MPVRRVDPAGWAGARSRMSAAPLAPRAYFRGGSALHPPTSEEGGLEVCGGLEISAAMWDPGARIKRQRGAAVGITVTTMTIDDVERRRAEIEKIIQTPEFQERMQEGALLDREIDLLDELEDLDFLQHGSHTD